MRLSWVNGLVYVTIYRMKSLKLDHELAKLVLSGEKTSTWRIRDEKNISVNDRIELIDKVDPADPASWVVIGVATVNSVSEKRLGELTAEDFDGHEVYQTSKELIATYRGYYGDDVDEATPIKMIHFSFVAGTLTTHEDVQTFPSEIKMFADGGSRGNPGPSASGYVLLSMDDEVLVERGVYLGITTNNQAEYQAVKFALEDALKRGVKRISIYLDSLLVVNQMKGVFKVRNRDLWPIHQSIKELCGKFEKFSFTHVPRELNKLADAEVNKCLDREAGQL